MPDALREAVERTVNATREGAQETRGRTQAARSRAQVVVDEVARSTRGRAQDAVEGIAKGAEVVGERVRGAFEEARPATHDDIKDLEKELRAIGRRLDAIEERLPPERKPRASTTKRSSGGRPAKRGSGSTVKRSSSTASKRKKA